ncbi:hypothetical protein [Pseudonocardia humida]|uniref:hypothetical protein n=1 Tax=Pseudonocardia humida TaxID=2800819 RepID=UPI00207C788F|nr:hypothetical protein [Pseudonocardia humida]
MLVSTGREPWDPAWPDPDEPAAGPTADAVRRLRLAVVDQEARSRSFGVLIASLRAEADRDTALVDQLDADLRRLRERHSADAARLAELEGGR